MERHEIINYLALDAAASIAEVQAAVAEKLKTLEAVSDGLGSEFLKKMHQKNLDKAQLVKNEVMLWKEIEKVPEPVLSVAPVVSKPEEHSGKSGQVNAPVFEPVTNYFTTPVIIGSKSKSSLDNAGAAEPLGWLVRHTENQTAITFSLFRGKNYLGRKKQPGLPAFILVDDDVYMSRIHAMIEAGATGDYEFYISDNELSNLGKASKNGTYINGSETRISQKTRLFENDTVQVGVTKMILKINRDNNLKKVIKEVQSSKFMDTVIIDSGFL
ncbi:MAG: FHA domain-containing protein [Bacteroidota bacterium]